MHDLNKVSRSLSDGFESVGVPIASFYLLPSTQKSQHG